MMAGMIDNNERKTLVKPKIFGLRIIAEAVGDSNRQQLAYLSRKPRTGRHNNVCQFEQFLVAMPQADFTKRVEAHDEKKFVLGILFAQLPEGFNRKAGTAASPFEITDSERGVAGEGRLNHRQALGERNVGRDLLVGRLPGRNKPDLIEPAAFVHLLGDVEMTVMDGIEGAPEQTDTHRYDRT